MLDHYVINSALTVASHDFYNLGQSSNFIAYVCFTKRHNWEREKLLY